MRKNVIVISIFMLCCNSIESYNLDTEKIKQEDRSEKGY